MTIFWRLVLGHLLADFTFQSDFINAWKRKSVWGMLAHSAVHPIVYLVLTLPYLNQFWVKNPYFQIQGWTCVLLLFILHFIEDEWRVYTIFRFKTPDNTLYFFWDQVIHYSVIFLLVPLGMEGLNGGLIPEKWPILASLFVMTTHFTTVLIYFLEKDFWGKQFPAFDEKYITMMERLVLSMCFMVPGRLWAVLAPVWLCHMFYLRYQRVHDFSWLSFYLGGASAILYGVLGRLVYYS